MRNSHFTIISIFAVVLLGFWSALENMQIPATVTAVAIMPFLLAPKPKLKIWVSATKIFVSITVFAIFFKWYSIETGVSQRASYLLYDQDLLIAGSRLAILFSCAIVVGGWLSRLNVFSGMKGPRAVYLPNQFALLSVGTIGLIMVVMFVFVTGSYTDILAGNISEKRYLDASYGQTTLFILRVGSYLLLFSAIVYFNIAVESGKGKFWFAFIFYSVAFILFSVIVSSRSNIVYLLAALFIILQVQGRKSNILILFLGATFVGLLSYVSQARGTNDDFSFSALAAGFSRSMNQISNAGYFYNIEKLSLIVDAINNGAVYLYGKSFYLPLVFWIPRAIWPSKPAIRLGEDFRDIAYPDLLSTLPPSYPVELFWNFGVSGIVIGGMILGIIAYRQERFFNCHSRFVCPVKWAIVTSCFIIPLLLSDFGRGAIQVIIVLILYKIVFRRHYV